MDKVVSYAQNREDLILAGFFNGVENGFYVDIGASDPVKDSVTKFFYDRGWTGINVEPNPTVYKKLCKERPRDINVNAAISNDTASALSLRVYKKGDGLSTLSEDVKSQYVKDKTGVTKEFQDINVKIIPLRELFEMHQVSHIQFMKIDVEGYEYEVLASNDWDTYRPEVICIESNHMVKDWRTLLKEARYEKVFFDGLNEYYASVESKKAQIFSYIESIIGKRIIDADTSWELNDLENKRMIIDYQLQNSRKYTQELEERIRFLDAHIFQQQRTKNLMKHLAINIDQIIMRNINKLTKKQHYYPALSVVGIATPKKLLDILHDGDTHAFINKPTLGWKIKAFFGEIVLLTYRGLRKIVAVIGKFVFKKVLRPLKRMVKK